MEIFSKTAAYICDFKNLILAITRTNCPYTAQVYRKTEMQPVEKRQKAETARKLTGGRT